MGMWLSRRSVLLAILSLVPVLLLYVWCFGWVLTKRAEYAAVREQLTPRIARVEGIRNTKTELRERQFQLESQLVELVFPPGDDRASTAASLQQQLRANLESSGLSVSGSQILSPRADENFDQIVVSINASGDTIGLAKAMESLAGLRPLVVVQELDAQAQRARRGQEEGQISVRMQLMALRLTKPV
jgi:general secretion pathway protein M